MKTQLHKLLLINILIYCCPILSQAQQGFFLNSWQLKNIVAPTYVDSVQTNKPATASITIHVRDTITKIPVYMFGDNANTFTTSMSENKTLMKYITDRKMGVLRGPSGSISDVYFWNRSQSTPATDVPDTLISGGSGKGWQWPGKRVNAGDAAWSMDIDSFYSILRQTDVTGLLTVNYGYARYGTSTNPVAQAAHLAADWVRYDKGKTKFWEIGNEVFGSWEAGYKIDTSRNKDGQPEYINGSLYGQHCKVFIDSMRVAASETGAEIFIGAVAVEGSSTGPANWNVDLMQEVGNVVDFYIIHSYYTPYNQNSNAAVILNAPSQTQEYMNYLNTCSSQAGQVMKPVALTEYNIFAIGSKQMVSQVNGIFAVMVTGEAINSKLGEASRWDLANGWGGNGDDMGMYSYGNEPGVAQFAPRPAFYYLYYMQKYLGDVLLKTSYKGSSDIIAYSSSFSSGQTSTILVNKGVYNQVVRVNIDSATIGNRYYSYTLIGGTDVPADPLMPFSRKVYVNGYGPSGVAGGPLNYASIKAQSSPISNEILVEMPPFSVTYLLVDSGSNQLVKNDSLTAVVKWNNPADIQYGTTLSSTQLNATASIPGKFVYSPKSGTKLNAGSGIKLYVTFTPTDTFYSPVTKSVVINVLKGTPLIAWNTPGSIYYGTSLGNTQLNAFTGLPGKFIYNPPATTILNAGTAISLQVTFFPTDSVNYLQAPKTVKINVWKLTPQLQWINPADIPAGTPLGSSQLNANANITGSYIYQPQAGTMLDTGSNQSLQVFFTPGDTINYNSINKTVKINVNDATGIANASLEELKIYPVPVADRLTIENTTLFLGKSVSLEIITLDGKVAYTLNIPKADNTILVDVTSLDRGFYLLKLRSTQAKVIRRFIKQ
jgi:hypothetical protein